MKNINLTNDSTNVVTHKLGTKAKILFSSVFGPYAQDDEYGSRKLNPMELYQNQVTRVQGVFSLRMFHRSFGLKLLQENIDAPCTLLDFPSLERFISELENNSYDIIGISSIFPNIYKLKKMCELIRKFQPNAKIVVGGHVTNIDWLSDFIDADHIIKGEGVTWFRKYLGQDETLPIKHPSLLAGFGTRIAGLSVSGNPKETAAVLIPSVGCPMGCNFCSTSTLFGGKGKFIDFYKTGEQLFNVMLKIEKDLGVNSFFVLDENFLLHKKRALELLSLMEKNNKSWALSVFSSAKVLSSYSIEQILGLGITWIWMGIEGKSSDYEKLHGINTHSLISKFQANGIRVLGSSIIGLENHTPENINEVIDHAVSHNTVFHQFMLYTPIPGTPLYKDYDKKGILYPQSKISFPDTHGQYRFNYKHAHIKDGQEQKFIIDAFKRDFQINGPSLLRLVRVMLDGWKKHKHNPSKRIRKRYIQDIKPLSIEYAGVVWSMKKWYKNDKPLLVEINALLKDLYTEFNVKTRVLAPIVGRYIFRAMKREEKKLANGWAYEPTTSYEKNDAAINLEKMKLSHKKIKIHKKQLKLQGSIITAS